MRFAILSDSHDNLTNTLKVIDYLNQEKIAVAIHCGDIATEETIQQIEEKFEGEISFVRGNADFSIKNVPDTLDLDIGGKKVGVVHFPNLAKQLAQSGKYDLVFYGHTHKPWEEKVGDCRLVNPGELAGHRFQPTFAIYDTETDKLELKILSLINF